MSRWTHVIGSLYIETYKERKDIKGFVENILNDAPKITGGEKDTDIFVNPLSGHNTYTNCDCENCQYGKTIVHLEEGGFQCDAESDYECPEGKYQTCVAITLVGDLRDKDGETTKKEIEEFIRFLQKQDFDIDYHSVRIEDEWGGKYDLYIKYKEDNYEDKGEILWNTI